MNIYLLKRGELETIDYDETAGWVVRAESELDARAVVARSTYDTGGSPGDEGRQLWLDETATTCELLASNAWGLPVETRDSAGVVLRDFRAG